MVAHQTPDFAVQSTWKFLWGSLFTERLSVAVKGLEFMGNLPQSHRVSFFKTALGEESQLDTPESQGHTLVVVSATTFVV